MLSLSVADIRVWERDGGDLMVDLAGEFDGSNLAELRETLEGVVASRRRIFVDLSRVTFLDVGSTRELAAYSQLYGHHATLCDPSPEVLASVAACCLEEWVRFGLTLQG